MVKALKSYIRSLTLLDYIALLGEVVSLLIVVTGGLIPWLVVEGPISGTISGFLAHGDLASWNLANIIGVMYYIVFSLHVVALVLILFGHRSKLWLGVSSSILMGAMTGTVPLLNLAKIAVAEGTSICAVKLRWSAFYGYIAYNDVLLCRASDIILPLLYALLLSTAATGLAVIARWFEELSQ